MFKAKCDTENDAYSINLFIIQRKHAAVSLFLVARDLFFLASGVTSNLGIFARSFLSKKYLSSPNFGCENTEVWIIISVTFF